MHKTQRPRARDCGGRAKRLVWTLCMLSVCMVPTGVLFVKRIRTVAIRCSACAPLDRATPALRAVGAGAVCVIRLGQVQ